MSGPREYDKRRGEAEFNFKHSQKSSQITGAIRPECGWDGKG